MKKFEIVTHPDTRLEQECSKVTVFDRKLHEKLDQLFDLMMEHDGIGIAAPQAGITERIAIVYLDDETGVIEMINPEIKYISGEEKDVEGCLSFPGIFGEVNRTDQIVLTAQDRNGKTFVMEADGYLSRAIQHEADHLDGILFTSKVTRYVTEEELKALEEGAE
ncbi:peptide deformylase [Jeotgalibacillus haloalkalitolerans]|uniref:Peptide deformylase n=1 Tax=Jeotgalibacillus haloalkalitolerans TaxID=3104292 RepID=A0ABU5KK39_9BACL|nr:peptide deformylase [Jeotgalibacillus sp. HH7-29]MDZ5711603.1 peptide deformylase [Jeotgalibacillus sp. HH7-29]